MSTSAGFGVDPEVAPFVGVWIEIMMKKIMEPIQKVAPFVGVWIEINMTEEEKKEALSRSLCGSVD